MNIAVWSLSPVYLLLAGIPSALTGCFASTFMIANAYIVDITTEQTRSSRTAMVQAAFGFGVPGGFLFSDFLFHKIGYLGSFSVTASLFFLSILYVLIRVKETRGPWAKIHPRSSLTAPIENYSETDRSSIFSLSNIKDSLYVTFRRREHNIRPIILMLIVNMCLIVLVYGKYIYTI